MKSTLLLFAATALAATSLSAKQFTVDYATLLTADPESSRTDVIQLSTPYKVDLGQGDETITEVTVTTTYMGGAFKDSGGHGLVVVGGDSDASFDSQEQVALSFSIQTTLGNPVTDIDIDLLGAAARAADGDTLRFSTGGDSATVTWPASTNSAATPGTLSAVELSFSPLQTLIVQAGPLAGDTQDTQLSSVTFELSEAQAPNVIIFMMDDFGWPDMQEHPTYFPHGSPLHETPHMHRLAERGMRFTRAYAQPLCSPSRATLLSGQYSAARDFLYRAITGGSPPDPILPTTSNPKNAYNFPQTRNHLPLEIETIAERMRDAGYATWHAGKWHLTADSRNPDYHEPFFPVAQGFDKQLGVGGSGPPAYYGPFSAIPSMVDAFGNNAPGTNKDFIGDHYAALVQELIGDHISNNPGTPFFLHYCPFSVHGPHESKRSSYEYYKGKLESLTDSKHEHPVFAAQVEGVDDELGALLDYLDANNLNNNTLLFFLSDNGGLSFKADSGKIFDDVGDDGIPDVPGGSSSDADFSKTTADVASSTFLTDMDPLKGSKSNLYEGGVRVPMIVSYPRGGTLAGDASDEAVHLVDIYKTILDYTPATPKAGYVLDGESLKPALQQNASLPDRDIYIFFPRNLTTSGSGAPGGPGGTVVINPPYKLFASYSHAHDAATEQYELYHLDDDIGEANDIAAYYPEIVDEMRKRLDAWYVETDAPVPTPNPNYNGTNFDEAEITKEEYYGNAGLTPSTPASFNLGDPDEDGRNSLTEFLQQTDPNGTDASTRNFWLCYNDSEEFYELRIGLPAEVEQSDFEVYDSSEVLLDLASDFELDGQYGKLFVYKPITPTSVADVTGYSIKYEPATQQYATSAEFSIDYASILGGAQFIETRTDEIPLSVPVSIDTGSGYEQISSIFVTTNAIGTSQDNDINKLRNSGGNGLVIVGGASNGWFDSEERFNVQFSAITTLGTPVTGGIVRLIGASARAINTETMTFTTSAASTEAVWGGGSVKYTPGALASELGFPIDQTLEVQTGPFGGNSGTATKQQTMLSSLTFSLNVQASLDSDGDLIPDDYESANSLDPNDPSDGDTDNDGDGASRGQEFLMGTSDFDGADRASLLFHGSDGISSRLGFYAKDQKAYRIFKSINLIDWELCEDFGVISGNHEAMLIDTEDASRAFYRLNAYLP